MLIPLKPGQFDEAAVEKYEFERNQPTVAAITVKDNQILQVTNRKIVLLTQQGKLLSQHEFEDGIKSVGHFDNQSEMICILSHEGRLHCFNYVTCSPMIVKAS